MKVLSKSLICTFIGVLLCGTLVYGNVGNGGFKYDDYGTSFYYDSENYYDNGWHLIDDNLDNIYEYMYFTITGHILKNTNTPNGYQLDEKGKLIIDNKIYSLSTVDIIENKALFNGYVLNQDEIKQALLLDYALVLDDWYYNSTDIISNNYNSIKDKPSVKSIESLRQNIQKQIKKLKKINSWYSEKICDAKLNNKITKEFYRELDDCINEKMNEYVGKLRKDWNDKVNKLKY